LHLVCLISRLITIANTLPDIVFWSIHIQLQVIAS
jgi:hypothetical protein